MQIPLIDLAVGIASDVGFLPPEIGPEYIEIVNPPLDMPNPVTIEEMSVSVLGQ